MPVEVRISGWHFARPSSLAADLNCFLHTNVDAVLHHESLDELLSVYMEAYTSCLPKGTACRFTEEELKVEYLSKNTYGKVMAAMTMPLTMKDAMLTANLRNQDKGIEDLILKID